VTCAFSFPCPTPALSVSLPFVPLSLVLTFFFLYHSCFNVSHSQVHLSHYRMALSSLVPSIMMHKSKCLGSALSSKPQLSVSWISCVF
jgi:hypothetical protein